MKLRVLLVTGLFAITGTTAAVASAPPAVHVRNAWIRWLPAGLPSGAYATIANGGGATVRLTGASSPDYGMVMLHESRLAHGDSSMVMIDHLDIPAHGSATLAPGGYHLMLMHAKKTIKPGDKVPIILRFAGGDTLQVDFPVLPANASGPPD